MIKVGLQVFFISYKTIRRESQLPATETVLGHLSKPHDKPAPNNDGRYRRAISESLQLKAALPSILFHLLSENRTIRACAAQRDEAIFQRDCLSALLQDEKQTTTTQLPV